MIRWKDIQGVNLGFALELYERFQKDPTAVDAETRRFFELSPPPADGQAREGAGNAASLSKIVGAVNLAESIRKFGHMDAQIDPLGSPPPGDPEPASSRHPRPAQDRRSRCTRRRAGK